MVIPSNDLKRIETASKFLVKQAGKFIVNSWGKTTELHYKDIRDVYTQVDIESEKILRDGLSDIFPEAGFIVEEGKTKKEKTYNWTIDPIDGTKNYAFHLPLFFVQIALLENDTPILGHIYNPLANQFFSATRGHGAYLNEQKIVNLPERTPDEAIIDIEFGGRNRFFQENLQILNKLAENVFRFRLTGGGFATYLLTGALDGYVVLNATTKLVDQAPRILLMQEAGYKVEYIKTKDRDILVAGSSKVFAIIEKTIKNSHA